ncbi:unnamed protein product [Closterium sp. Naga37s-1]|nr:unnamed protein product [Closterium sp. Naga37s-1]
MQRHAEHVRAAHQDSEQAQSALILFPPYPISSLRTSSHSLPMSLTKTLNKRVPEPVTILGRPLVIWFDRVSDQWRVFHDLCPHRLAPLSEGRIHESGQLQCSYHGWTFSGEGSCGLIPQAPADGPAVNASPRACARVYPSRVHEGIIWFWPNCSPSAAAEAAAAPPPPSLPEFDDPSFRYDTGMADLEYCYEMLMENLLDPAHVPFAHHKYQADRNKAGPLPSMAVTSITARGIEGTSFVGSGLAAVVPPCTLIQKLLIGGKVAEGSGKKQRTAILFFHCIPRLPGQSRLIWFFMNNIIPPWVPMPPEWFVHLTRMKVLDTDHPLLHLTERRLEEEGGAEQGVKNYYTPTSADSFVSAYRSWLLRFAGGKARFPAYVNPQLPPAKSRREILDSGRSAGLLRCIKIQTSSHTPHPPILPKTAGSASMCGSKFQNPEEMLFSSLSPFCALYPSPPLNRLHPRQHCRQRFHVRLCPDCQRVQRWSDRLRTALWAASLLLLAATALLPIAPPAIRQAAGPMGAVFAAAAAVVCAAAAHWLKGFIERNYVYEDFVHALWYPAKK